MPDHGNCHTKPCRPLPGPAVIDRLPLEELRRLAHHQRCLINAFRRQNSDQRNRIRDLEQQIKRLQRVCADEHTRMWADEFDEIDQRRAATIHAPIPVIDSDPNVLGEHLREVTFVGEGYGCYETFDVRPDAEDLGHEAAMEFFDVDPSADWPLDVKFEGRRFHYQGLTVECYWFWDGDGTLAFRITHPQLGVLRVIENDDCKKSHCWDDVDHG